MRPHAIAGPAVSLFLLALLAGLALWNLAAIETLHRGAGRVAELGAEQQAAAQRVLLGCLDLSRSHEATDARRIADGLRETLGRMENSHRLLTATGGPVPEVFASSDTLHALYFEPPADLNARVLDFVATARTILANPADAPAMTAELGHLEELARDHLTDDLLRASRLYRREIFRRARRLRRTGMALLAALLATLGVSAVVVFRPLAKRVDDCDGSVARLTARLEECAVIDQVTRVANRRRMEEILEREIQHAARYDCKLVCMFVRVEDFRAINEEYGPDAGDRLLAEMALLLKNNLRITDYLFRYGGPVFAVLAPNTDEDGAAVMADKIRRLAESNRFHRRIPLRVRTTHSRYECDESAGAFLSRAQGRLDAGEDQASARS